MSIDSIGNFLTVIRNGLMVRRRTVTVPYSHVKMEIARVLKEEGFVRDYLKEESDKKSFLTVTLKYVDGEAAIHELTRISKPSKRHYEGAHMLRPVIGGLGTAIITTSSGIMTDKKARTLGVGGEVICHVW